MKLLGELGLIFAGHIVGHQVSGVGRDDAVAFGEIGDFIDEFLGRLFGLADFAQQIIHLFAGPQAGHEGTFVVFGHFGEVELIGKGFLPAAHVAGDADGFFAVAGVAAVENDLLAAEDVIDLLGVNILDFQAGELDFDLGHNRASRRGRRTR